MYRSIGRHSIASVHMVNTSYCVTTHHMWWHDGIDDMDRCNTQSYCVMTYHTVVTHTGMDRYKSVCVT